MADQCEKCQLPAAVQVYAYQPGMWYLNPDAPVDFKFFCSQHFDEWETQQVIPDLKRQ